MGIFGWLFGGSNDSDDGQEDEWIQKHDSTAFDNSTSLSVRTDEDNYTHAVYDNDTGEIHHMDSMIDGEKYNWGYGGEEQGWEDSGDSGDSGSSSSGCYIATATLQGKLPVGILEPLKQWRYTILETNFLGLKLSNFYRQTAPEIAAKIAKMPRASSVLLTIFVKPALWLVSRKRNFIRDILLLGIFLAGMVVAKIISLLR